VKIPVILLTTFDDHATMPGNLRGVKGYLLKDVSLARLPEAVRLVAAGGRMISPLATERLLQGLEQAPPRHWMKNTAKH
jgi:DNA-binding NarL/FixJ family response regulator